MIPSRQLRRLALLVTLLLSSPGSTHSASFGFPSCVGECVGSAGCSTTSARCICVSARSDFLISVVGCMFKNCQNRPVSADSDFLDHVTSVCESRNMPVPPDKVATASAVAASLISLLPPFSTTNPVQPSTTAATRGGKSTTTAPPRQTSSSSSDDSSPPSTDTNTFATTTTVTPQDPATGGSPSPTSSQAPPQQGAPPPSEPTDSSPFATPNGGTLDAASPWIGAAIPLLAMLELI